MKIALIARDPENSPNMVSKDAAILECIKNELEKRGADVIAIDGKADIPCDVDAVCHMSRNSDVLERLKKAERNGIKIVNSPASVENCSRTRIMNILKSCDVQQPEFRIIEKCEELEKLHYPAWIKRGEGWNCREEDTCYVTDCNEAIASIKEMQSRGIGSFVYTRHCKGDVVKFYGIEDRYFSYCYPHPEQTKFGLEKLNGPTRNFPFDANTMREMVFKAAKATGLMIYGGDCIIDEKGNITIIDLNDFPSFSSVREEAAIEIAKTVIKNITE